MHPDDFRRVAAGALIGLPAIAWVLAVGHYAPHAFGDPFVLWRLVIATPQSPILLASLAAGLVLAAGILWGLRKVGRGGFAGAPFRTYLRGTRVVSASVLRRKTKERGRQISVAGIPMPRKLESLHLLVNGSTGSGKSVLMRELAYSALLRGDRAVVLDPNGDMLQKFYRPCDVILNPYDSRTAGWTFFNEIRNAYDWQRYAMSVVPVGQTEDAEYWRTYGRLLLRETAKKLSEAGAVTMKDLFYWTTLANPKDLKELLQGTDAASLFVGVEKALASARFVLSTVLPEHANMPAGDFSIRTWLEEGRGNLFLTWREDMAVALRPLISAWTDVVCTSVLSMPENNGLKLALLIDELGSLEKLASLPDAAEKGRKHGLRIIAGLQSTSKLGKIYGHDEAQNLRSNFRSLVVLGGARTDDKTNEEMSKSLGEHEVERYQYSASSGQRSGRTRSIQRSRERVVMPSEIASLPDLTGYVAFGTDYPIARTTLRPITFANRTPAFVQRNA